ncbi:phosphatase PAP2 family protein [Danxiaibacter flavus]|uniref:Phosphatase PAP2 family protein n=1 Tax=Danxiaibacter flavus TaxID=3049108 RepID=A0ABV3ZJS1_9BACT|nr:phosphatase PAP2 family protein [Chitinophagaceae bacterium DXS]
MDILQSLENIDKYVFHLINDEWTFSWLNGLMLLLREPATWVPLYIGVLFFIYKKDKQLAIPFLLCSIVTFAITDVTSASILKPMLARLRPCQEAGPDFSVNALVGCGGLFGMPSSHASNHFGLATFWFIAASCYLKQKWYWVWLWAVAVCYAQVYVGKHYPGDIIAGAILGIIGGNITMQLLYYWMQLQNKRKNTRAYG